MFFREGILISSVWGYQIKFIVAFYDTHKLNEVNNINGTVREKHYKFYNVIALGMWKFHLGEWRFPLGLQRFPFVPLELSRFHWEEIVEVPIYG